MKYLLPFPKPQIKATFLGRPQRFLAEMLLADGSHVVAYCSNPGSMNGCLVSGSKTLLWDSCDPKRKRLYTWRAIKIGKTWVGTDTQLTNRITEEAIRQRVIPGLDLYETLKPEARVDDLRVDFLLTRGETRCLVEVKSSTVTEHGIARYPDSITPRGLRQLQELSVRAIAGYSVILVFVAQRSDVTGFSVTDKFHPEYASAFRYAVSCGVRVIALATDVSPKGISFPRLVPVMQD